MRRGGQKGRVKEGEGKRGVFAGCTNARRLYALTKFKGEQLLHVDCKKSPWRRGRFINNDIDGKGKAKRKGKEEERRGRKKGKEE